MTRDQYEMEKEIVQKLYFLVAVVSLHFLINSRVVLLFNVTGMSPDQQR
jgi:hypothetical protein